jgi:GNAT superfamily N-acetyltransferase
MIRKATERDIPRISEIRNAVRENRLLDPSRVTIADVRWFIANPGIFVWEEAGRIVGFSAADPRNGSIWALFMDQAYEGRGIARALFTQSCRVLMQAGWERMWLNTQIGTRAERFYRAAGWQVVGLDGSELRLETATPFRVRRYRPEDQEAVVEQFLGLNRHEDAITHDRRTDRAGAEECLAAALRDVEVMGGAALVAERSARVVAHAFVLWKQDAPYVRPELRAYAYVSELYVRGEARHLGIATTLMAAAEHVAREHGFNRMMVGVLKGNAPAEALYAGLGFDPQAIELRKLIRPPSDP